MATKGGLITRTLIATFGGLYNDLIGRRSHLGVAAVILDEAGRILLVHQSYGRRGWDLPGGGRKRGESLEQALAREVREEIGVQVSKMTLTGVYFEPDVDQQHFAFRVELSPGAIPAVTSPEILDCRYWAIDALPRPISQFTERRIRDAQAGNGTVAMGVIEQRGWLP
jgi:8-oxo-dGTP pyrophosphatase MutT (NUDIX family)